MGKEEVKRVIGKELSRTVIDIEIEIKGEKESVESIAQKIVQIEI